MGYPSYYAQHGWYQIHEGRERPFNENAEQPEHMDSHNFRNIRVRHRLARCIPVVRVAIYLLPLAYLPTEVVRLAGLRRRNEALLTVTVLHLSARTYLLQEQPACRHSSILSPVHILAAPAPRMPSHEMYKRHTELLASSSLLGSGNALHCSIHSLLWHSAEMGLLCSWQRYPDRLLPGMETITRTRPHGAMQET
jgi:hypothetical protein